MSQFKSEPIAGTPRGWLDSDRRDRYRTFTRKAEAERHLAAVEVAKLSRLYVSDRRASGAVLLHDYAGKAAPSRSRWRLDDASRGVHSCPRQAQRNRRRQSAAPVAEIRL